MTREHTLLTGGSLVAAGMMGMHVAAYGLTIVAARTLVPSDLGALTALLAILLVGTVVSLGLQASTARRLAVEPQNRDEIVATVARVTIGISIATGLVAGTAAAALSPALRLDSIWLAALTGAALIPLTAMGALAGIAQGTERWGTLTTIYLANGVGRLLFGVGALVIEPSVTSAMVGIAIGSWLPVVAGVPMIREYLGRERHPTVSRKSFVREAVLGSHALLAYLVLSNLDAIVARTILDPFESGLYASGLILTKAALFFPQFISVVLFPLLARDDGQRSRLTAVAMVGALGVVAVSITAALPQVALILVGGDQYADVADRLWLFALAGSCLAIVHLLVFDALARHAHGVAISVWGAVAVVLVVAYGIGVGLTGLVLTMAAVAAVLSLLIVLVPNTSRD